VVKVTGRASVGIVVAAGTMSPAGEAMTWAYSPLAELTASS